ncbi:MAG: DUF6265 family protein [Saprospiraceae bacterium]
MSSCSSKIKPFLWLSGTWEMYRSAGGTRLEIWTPYTDESIVGRGLMFNDKDTTMLEQIQLVSRDKDFYYIATVPDQNNGNPIEFKLVKTEGQVYTFENPHHDFPQRIVYTFKPLAEQVENNTNADSLLVRVESLDGKGIDYGFSRKK